MATIPTVFTLNFLPVFAIIGALITVAAGLFVYRKIVKTINRS